MEQMVIAYTVQGILSMGIFAILRLVVAVDKGTDNLIPRCHCDGDISIRQIGVALSSGCTTDTNQIPIALNHLGEVVAARIHSAKGDGVRDVVPIIGRC